MQYDTVFQGYGGIVLSASMKKASNYSNIAKISRICLIPLTLKTNVPYP